MTELVSGLDIVREQFWLAAGAPLSDAALAAAAGAATPNGHAIEVRLSAEDPARDFAPTPGRVRRWVMPSGPGIRVDTALEGGDRVPAEYDNLIAKIMVHGGDRASAIARLRRALDETEVSGIQTTLPFHRRVARHPAFIAGDLSTDWADEHWDGAAELRTAARIAQLAAGLAAFETTTSSAGVPVARPEAGSGDGVWRTSAREVAIDRWPG